MTCPYRECKGLIMRLCRFLSILGVLMFCGPAYSAQQAATPVSPPTVVMYKIKGVVPAEAGLGESIEIRIDDLSQWIKQNGLDRNKLTLYLDSRPIKGIFGTPLDGGIRFDLESTKESQDVWDTLQDRPTLTPREVQVGVGGAGGNPLLTSSFKLVIIPRRMFFVSLMIVGASLALFVWLAMNTSIIRDSNPTQSNPSLKTYSLGKFQMAVWYFLVLAAFLFIWTIKGTYPPISDQVLGLIGIASGTALGSIAIDLNKSKTALVSLENANKTQAVLSSEIQDLQVRAATAAAGLDLASQAEKEGARAALATKTVLLAQADQKAADSRAALTPGTCISFLNDLLTDADGISFHRFQILIWTLVLGFVFIISVWRNLKMPAFDSSLLTLMGISGATYLGFKFPEKQS